MFFWSHLTIRQNRIQTSSRRVRMHVSLVKKNSKKRKRVPKRVREREKERERKELKDRERVRELIKSERTDKE